eukprot:1162081-Pleurochrysis_carterae.AAC.1
MTNVLHPMLACAFPSAHARAFGTRAHASSLVRMSRAFVISRVAASTPGAACRCALIRFRPCGRRALLRLSRRSSQCRCHG